MPVSLVSSPAGAAPHRRHDAAMQSLHVLNTLCLEFTLQPSCRMSAMTTLLPVTAPLLLPAAEAA